MTYINDKTFFKKTISVSNTTERQDLTNSFADVVGSLITYTPELYANNILYEYVSTWVYKDTTSKLNFRLLEYNTGTSSWDTIAGSYLTIKSKKSGSGQINFRYILNNVSSQKQLKLQCKEESSSTEGYLHSNEDNNRFYDPYVTCSSI
tara:strand:+ start:199 stop:645 length:447 start_codon:yes stop_codon:yes gene_type:complete